VIWSGHGFLHTNGAAAARSAGTVMAGRQRQPTDPPTDSKYDLAGVPDPAEKTTMTTFVKALRGSNLHDAVRTRSVAGSLSSHARSARAGES
jgi:hypothetical protein